MGDGLFFKVDPDELNLAAQGIQNVIDEMSQLGTDGDQLSGSPIEDLALSADEAGSDLIANPLSDLLSRAHYALRDLLKNGQRIVTALRDNSRTYMHADGSLARDFQSILNDLVGNPMGQSQSPTTTVRPITPAPPASGQPDGRQ